ncbi:MAG: formate dehydrogenase accessory protein FdhE [Desulfitobacteriaceae bacterium]|nr:formate dehydrogenase accessory protein FdhE [Desulfitobacteriaceae bacterium]MDI6879376.1 formate dehydrogenase accessory protein FdhE [Desulfitobacteriaceae bacterium]MDI6913999.1 formate dehydrogenase accessory protein FdhE [Desulfitobacteriaceae bacterium]
MKEDEQTEENEQTESVDTELKVEKLLAEEMSTARQAYEKLLEVSETWQKENATRLSTWKRGIAVSEAKARSYFTLEQLPEDAVLDLWEKLNAAVEAENSYEAMQEMLSEYKAYGKIRDQVQLTRLYFALSGVARLAKAQLEPERLETAGQDWEHSICPVCGEETRLALLAPPVGKRYRFCQTCGHEWATKRVGCILCGSEQASEQNYLHSEEYPGVEIVVCHNCGDYFKEFDLREHALADYVWEDMRTLPLNFAAEQWLAEAAKTSGKLS